MIDPRTSTPRVAGAPKAGLARSLGQFVGHIWQAVRHDPATSRRVVRHEVEEEVRGTMILRRTTIEEMEFRPPEARPPQERQS